MSERTARDVLADRIQQWADTEDWKVYDYADRLLTDLSCAGFEVIPDSELAVLDEARKRAEERKPPTTGRDDVIVEKVAKIAHKALRHEYEYTDLERAQSRRGYDFKVKVSDDRSAWVIRVNVELVRFETGGTE